MSAKKAVGHSKKREIAILGSQINPQTGRRIPTSKENLVVVVDDAIAILILVSDVPGLNFCKSLFGSSIDFLLAVEEAKIFQSPQTIYVVANSGLIIVLKIFIPFFCFSFGIHPAHAKRQINFTNILIDIHAEIKA